MEPDKLDLEILGTIVKDAKLSFRKIAKKTGVSVATAMNRINRLEKEGIVKQYSAIFDFEKLGYDFQAIVDINVSKGMLFQVEKKIATHPNVAAVYDVTGHFDVMVIAYFKNRRTLDAFLKKIQGYDFVEKTETRIILNKIKEQQIDP